jgi:hypothetical protein
MLSPAMSPQRGPAIDASSHPPQMAQYRRKEVIDGDVVRTYETPRRQRQFSTAGATSQRQQPDQWTNHGREEALQAAMELPSSVLLAQGLRRFMNSDEPLYDVMEKESKRQLQREFLRDVGVIKSEQETASRRKVTFPPSPPMTPKPSSSRPVMSTDNLENRFCECCKTHCV